MMNWLSVNWATLVVGLVVAAVIAAVGMGMLAAPSVGAESSLDKLPLWKKLQR